MSVTLLGQGRQADSGIDLQAGSATPSAAPRRPPRHGSARPSPDRTSQRASGIYGFFNPEEIAQVESGSKRSSFQSSSLSMAASPDWEFEIVEEEHDDLQAEPQPTAAASHSAEGAENAIGAASPISHDAPLSPPKVQPPPSEGRSSCAAGRSSPLSDAEGKLTFVRGRSSPSCSSGGAEAAHSQLVQGRSTSPTSQRDLPSSPPAKVSSTEEGPSEGIVRSRTGTVVGRKGTVGNLRERFQRRPVDSSGQGKAPEAPPSLAQSRRESGNGAMIESEEEFASRRGSVLLKKGVVGQWKNLFHRKAHDLVTPKTLAQELAERESALGAKLGGCLVVYTSSTTTVRETYSDCQNFRCKFEERDVTLSRQFQTELRERCPKRNSVPQVFLNGTHFGDADTIERLNEDGKLGELIRHVPRFDPGESPCETCAGRGLIVCEWCDGDRKSVVSRFGRETVKLRCTVCNEHGLQPCPECRQAYSEA